MPRPVATASRAGWDGFGLVVDVEVATVGDVLVSCGTTCRTW
jgi:hypothetical protein